MFFEIPLEFILELSVAIKHLGTICRKMDFICCYFDKRVFPRLNIVLFFNWSAKIIQIKMLGIIIFVRNILDPKIFLGYTHLRDMYTCLFTWFFIFK